MAEEEIEDVDFDGPGPFAVPLLTKFERLSFARRKDFAVAEFVFEDGSRVHVPIATLAAAALVPVLTEWLGRRAKEKKN